MQHNPTSDRIARRLDDDALKEGMELYQLLCRMRVDDLTEFFMVARSFSWNKLEAAFWFLFLDLRDGKEAGE